MIEKVNIENNQRKEIDFLVQNEILLFPSVTLRK